MNEQDTEAGRSESGTSRTEGHRDDSDRTAAAAEKSAVSRPADEAPADARFSTTPHDGTADHPSAGGPTGSRRGSGGTDDKGSGGRGSGGKIWLIVAVVILLLLAAGIWYWWQNGDSQAAGDESGDDTQARLTALEQTDSRRDGQWDTLREQQRQLLDNALRENATREQTERSRLADRLDRLEEQLSRILVAQESLLSRQSAVERRLGDLSAEDRSVTREVRLAELAYLLRVAAERARLFSDRDGAMEALALALAGLDAVDEPALLGLRQRVEQAQAELAAMNPPDLAAVTGRLLALEQGVESWPLAGRDAPEAVAEGEGWWESTKSALSSLVVVRRDAAQDPALMHVDQIQALRANLRTELLAARLAALRRDQAAFEAALAQVESWRRQYFEDDETARAGDQIEALMAQQLQPAFPDLAVLSEQLRQQRRLMTPLNRDVGQRIPQSPPQNTPQGSPGPSAPDDRDSSPETATDEDNPLGQDI